MSRSRVKLYHPFIERHCLYLQDRNGTSRQQVPPKPCLISTRHQFSLSKYFTKWKLRLNAPKRQTILLSQHQPPLPDSIPIHGTLYPGPRTYNIQAFVQSHKLPYTKYLPTVTNKATGLLCDIFALRSRDARISQKSRSILTYVALVWSSTCDSIYLKLQAVQNKSLRVTP